MKQQLHGFSDTFERAYAACVYLRSELKYGAYYTKLIAAKTRVAPVKKVSLPRLELSAAHLLSKLMKSTIDALKLPNSTCVFRWSDSTVTLDWIRGSPSRWKDFVANRVSEIHDIIPPACWRHVPSVMNASDCASPGIMPSELIQHDLWWSGPDYLACDESHWHDIYRAPCELNPWCYPKPSAWLRRCTWRLLITCPFYSICSTTVI